MLGDASDDFLCVAFFVAHVLGMCWHFLFWKMQVLKGAYMLFATLRYACG